jgi:UDP-N-acetylglucosamine 2-epimerase (non-hydrolysing)
MSYSLPEVHLGVGPGPAGLTGAAVSLRFAELLAEGAPAAVLLGGTSYAVLQCALVARQLGIPVIRLEGGEDRMAVEGGLSTLAALVDRCADLLCVASSHESQNLHAEGFLPSQIVSVGDMTAGVLRDLQPILPSFTELMGRLQLPADWMSRAAGGFGLISAQFEEADVTPGDALQWLMLARYGSTELPMLWPVSERTAAVMRHPSIQAQLESSGIAVVRGCEYLQLLSLLTRVRCVVSGPARHFVAEASAGGIPSIVIQLYAETPAVPENGLVTRVGPSASQFKSAVRSAFHEGRPENVVGFAGSGMDAAVETVEQLARWLPRHALRAPLPELDEIAA